MCKTYNGKSAQSSVVAGELIFPQKLLKRNKVLECLNNKHERLQLEFACEGNFSIRPMDVKMHMAELVQHFNDFPISVMVISNHAKSKTSFSLSTGTILSLKESKMLQSYIYSTNIFGKKSYPLMELPLSIPIEIQCIEYANLDMGPIYNAILHAYENFKPSMVKQTISSTDHGLYEEVQKDDGTTHIYDLEKPNRIYESISGKVKGTKDVINDRFYPTHAPVKNSSSFTKTPPPFPPPRPTFPVTVKNPHRISLPPVSSISTATKSTTSSTPTSPAGTTSHMGSGKKYSVIVKKSPMVYEEDTAIATTAPYHNKSSPSPIPSTTAATAFHDNKEENVAYLKSFSLDNILQLLHNMNLGEHKKNFTDEQIDGEIIVHLNKADLVDLGVIKNIHQTRLLKLIDGSISAKKYHQHIAV